MICVDKFTVHSQDEQATLLAKKLPSGEAWDAKWIADSNLRKLLIAAGLEMMRSETYLNKIYCETQLETTNELIDEWEIEYGIKGGCLDGYGDTLEERIEAIKLKISINGTSLAEDFERIALELGLDITVIAGWDKARFNYTFPIYFFENEKFARFTMIVDMNQIESSKFDLEFDFKFGVANVSIMKCLFYKLKPANVRIVYLNE